MCTSGGDSGPEPGDDGGRPAPVPAGRSAVLRRVKVGLTVGSVLLTVVDQLELLDGDGTMTLAIARVIISVTWWILERYMPGRTRK